MNTHFNLVVLSGVMDYTTKGDNYVRFAIKETFEVKQELYARNHYCVSFNPKVLEKITDNMNGKTVVIKGELQYGSYALKDHPDTKVRTVTVKVSDLTIIGLDIYHQDKQEKIQKDITDRQNEEDRKEIEEDAIPF